MYQFFVEHQGLFVIIAMAMSIYAGYVGYGLRKKARLDSQG